MLKANEPTNVTAGRLVYDKDTGRATYSDDARLWQGETAVQAPTIVLDDVKGNLQAEGGVKSTLRLQDTAGGTTAEARTSVITAQSLLYEEAQRRATYTTDARMVGPEGDLRADRLELYLDAGGGALERAEAYDRVVLRADVSATRGEARQRLSWGERLTYFAADGRYVMSGPEVVIQEQRPAECVETKGRTLTFYRSADTILVDGNRERRTESTTTGKCPGQPTR
jgi:lipopolysaccharide export system protein LptA